MYENTTSSRIRTIDPQCSKDKFSCTPPTLANSSYYNVNPVNCSTNFKCPRFFPNTSKLFSIVGGL